MSIWKDFVTSALLGTERGQVPALPASLEEVLAPVRANLSREEAFLTQAGALAHWRRAGRKAGGTEVAPEKADPEELRLLTPESINHLRQMQSGNYTAILPEWLGRVTELGLRIPAEQLPSLLDTARQKRELRPLVTAAGGRRAAWLAQQNPVWGFSAAESPELWETGSRDQRHNVLRALRQSQPAEARAKLQTTWKEESADLRALFLEGFVTNLSMEDEPFLEGALDDRSKEVRRVSIDLLSRLPGSRLVQRMSERGKSALVFRPGKLLSRPALEIQLPDKPDAAGVRDGLESKALGSQKTFGEKATYLILILSSIPPQFWKETLHEDPAEIINVAAKNEFASALGSGWGLAAIRFQNAEWAELLLNSSIKRELVASDVELLTVLPEARRAARMLHLIQAGALKKADDWVHLSGSLLCFTGYWPEELGRAILAELHQLTALGIAWHLRGTIEELINRIPPHLLNQSRANWPGEKDGADKLLQYLNFRQEALSALGPLTQATR